MNIQEKKLYKDPVKNSVNLNADMKETKRQYTPILSDIRIFIYKPQTQKMILFPLYQSN